jgi:hypothetical protein
MDGRGTNSIEGGWKVRGWPPKLGFVILSEAKNLGCRLECPVWFFRFFASLRMTKRSWVALLKRIPHFASALLLHRRTCAGKHRDLYN